MAEDVTLGLAGILGESTNLKPINDRPFTRAAQQELSLGLKAKADEAKLAAEKAKIDREYMNMIKPISTGDKIADENISRGYFDLISSGNTRNYMAVKQFNDMSAFQKKAAEDEKKWKSDIDKIVLSPQEEKAFRNNDRIVLKTLSESPNSNVAYDQETQRYYPKEVFTKMDLNKVTSSVLNFDNQTPLNTADRKLSSIKGSNFASIAVDPRVKEIKLNELISNRDYTANFYNNYSDKVNIEMANSKVDLPTAIKTVMSKELDPYFRVQKDIKDLPKASGGGFNLTFGGGGSIDSNGIRIKPDPNRIGFVNVSKIVKEGKDPEILSATLIDKNGTPHNFAKIEGYYRLGKDNYRVVGSSKEGGSTTDVSASNIKAEQLAKSVGMSIEALEKTKIYFDADKEEEIRNDYLKSLQDKGSKLSYEGLYGASEIDGATFPSKKANEWYRETQSKTVAPKSTTKKETPQERAARIATGG
jgi:hypothetical protein